jgi:hypothetical protein
MVSTPLIGDDEQNVFDTACLIDCLHDRRPLFRVSSVADTLRLFPPCDIAAATIQWMFAHPGEFSKPEASVHGTILTTGIWPYQQEIASLCRLWQVGNSGEV